MLEGLGKLNMIFTTILFTIVGLLFIGFGMHMIISKYKEEKEIILYGLVFIFSGIYGICLVFYKLYQTYTNQYIAMIRGLDSIL